MEAIRQGLPAGLRLDVEARAARTPGPLRLPAQYAIASSIASWTAGRK